MTARLGPGGATVSGDLEATACDIGERIARQEGPVVVVGHSMGGALATLVAEGGWRFVVAVVNIEGNLTPADCTFSSHASVAEDMPSWVSDVRRQFSATESRYATALGRADADAVQMAARDLVRLSDGDLIGNRYAALRLPNLYIGGADVPAATLEFLEANHLNRTFIPRAGHWVMGDQPAETAAAIDRFVSSITP